MTNAAGDTVCWLLKGGHFTIFRYPNSDYTVPWSVNSQDDIVGQYQDQQNKTHGFILSPPLASQRWQQIDEPNAKGPMAVHSVNDHHTMVGFYADASHHVRRFPRDPEEVMGRTFSCGLPSRSQRAQLRLCRQVARESSRNTGACIRDV